jgi:hypothetical protein
MSPSLGDAAQTRLVAEQVAEAVIIKYRSEHPELNETRIPAPLKWAGAIIAGLFTMGTATLVFWLVSSVSEMQVTLARMDERMASGTLKDSRFEEIERRVSKLETYHQARGAAE